MLKHLSIVTALLVSPTAAALAQQPGTVLVAGIADAESGAALEQAIVRLPDFAYLARTDGMGRALVRGIPEGKWPVEVRRIGYKPMRVVLSFTGRDSLEAVLMLEKTVAALDTVQIVAEALPPYLKEFDRRKQQGIGRFRVRSQLMLEHANRQLADVIPWLFPGLRVDRQGTAARVVSFRGGFSTSGGAAMPSELASASSPAPASSSAPASAGGAPQSAQARRLAQAASKARASATGAGAMGAPSSSGCSVLVYLDGHALPEGDIGWLTVNDLAGVEYSSGTSGPVEYRRGSTCGVLILWTYW